jgi:hypothetical protein
MYIHDDDELSRLSEELIKKGMEKDVTILITGIGDNGKDYGDEERAMHYSSVGSMDVASKHYVPMYADYANDLMMIMDEGEVDKVLQQHLGVLEQVFWRTLEDVNRNSN